VRIAMNICSLCGETFNNKLQKCPTCGGDIIHLSERRARFFDRYLFDDDAVKNIAFSGLVIFAIVFIILIVFFLLA
jgi:uncharacterized membrane protein YvbJ